MTLTPNAGFGHIIYFRPRSPYSDGGWELENAGNAVFRFHAKRLWKWNSLKSQFPSFTIPTDKINKTMNQQASEKIDKCFY